MEAVRAVTRMGPWRGTDLMGGRAFTLRLWCQRRLRSSTHSTHSTHIARASTSRRYSANRELQRAPAPTETSRRLVVVDFDDTCTVGDTISHLVSATKALQPTQVVREKERLYKALLREYIEERNELVDRVFNADPSSLIETTGAFEKSDCPKRAWLDLFLRELSAFETRRNDEVLASGILHGATLESIKRASENVEFRAACLETLHQASISADTSVTVLSANWSEEFIRAALSNHHGACGGFDANKIDIVANALEFDAGRTTGGMRIRQCQTPRDKDRLLRTLVGGPHHSVYVGDSVGDICALLASSIGIVMGNNTLLEQVLERGGVEMRDIEALEEDGGARGETRGLTRVVYRTTSWEAVRDALRLR